MDGGDGAAGRQGGDEVRSVRIGDAARPTDSDHRFATVFHVESLAPSREPIRIAVEPAR